MKICKKVGIGVDRNGKGEFLLSHQSQTKPIIFSATRRKDTPWIVLDWVNRVIKSVNESQ